MKITINLNTRNVTIESAELHLTKLDRRDDANDCTGLSGALAAIIEGLEDAAAQAEVTAAAPEATPVVGVTSAAVVNALRDLIEAKPQWKGRSAQAIGKHLAAAGFDISELDECLREMWEEDIINARERRDGSAVYSLAD
jgi:hypothetical protein